MSDDRTTDILKDYEQLKTKYDTGKAEYDRMRMENDELKAKLDSKDKEIIELQASLYRNLSTSKAPEPQERHDFATDYQNLIRENMKG